MVSLSGIKMTAERAADKALGLALAGAVVTVVVAVLLPFWLISWAVYVIAWRRAWSPTRVRFLLPTAWAFPLAVWLSGISPAEQWGAAWEYAETGAYVAAWIPLLPWVVPAGLTAGALMWAARWNAARNGVYSSPRKAGVWIERQHEHAMRRARAEAKRPALVPMTTRTGDVVLGRAAHRTESGAGSLVPVDPRKLIVPLKAIEHHLILLGETGAGKTQAIQRLNASWQEGAWLQHALGAGDRPLSILLDCKGGRDGPATARGFLGTALSIGVDPARVGWYPSNVRFDLWNLEPRRMVEVIVAMIRSDRDHPFYAAVEDELIHLAVSAPCGPPESSGALIDRLSAEWMLRNYKADRPTERYLIEQNRQHLAGAQFKARHIFRRMGHTFDSGRHLDDFDALCVTLEGTENSETASAQAQAVTELLADLATNGGPSGEKRRVLVIVDEFSAISKRVEIYSLMERTRALGVSFIPAAQSWVSLGPTEDERVRLVAAAAGGMFAMGTNAPEAISKWAGLQVTVESMTRRTEQEDDPGSGAWSEEGTGRSQLTSLVPADRLRRLGSHPGQGVYIEHGRATWGVVTPVEVTRQALQLPPSGSVRSLVESYTRRPVGDRISLPALEAGLADRPANGRRSSQPAAPILNEEPGAGQ